MKYIQPTVVASRLRLAVLVALTGLAFNINPSVIAQQPPAPVADKPQTQPSVTVPRSRMIAPTPEPVATTPTLSPNQHMQPAPYPTDGSPPGPIMPVKAPAPTVSAPATLKPQVSVTTNPVTVDPKTGDSIEVLPSGIHPVTPAPKLGPAIVNQYSHTTTPATASSWGAYMHPQDAWRLNPAFAKLDLKAPNTPFLNTIATFTGPHKLSFGAECLIEGVAQLPRPQLPGGQPLKGAVYSERKEFTEEGNMYGRIGWSKMLGLYLYGNLAQHDRGNVVDNPAFRAHEYDRLILNGADRVGLGNLKWSGLFGISSEPVQDALLKWSGSAFSGFWASLENEQRAYYRTLLPDLCEFVAKVNVEEELRFLHALRQNIDGIKLVEFTIFVGGHPEKVFLNERNFRDCDPKGIERKHPVLETFLLRRIFNGELTRERAGVLLKHFVDAIPCWDAENGIDSSMDGVMPVPFSRYGQNQKP